MNADVLNVREGASTSNRRESGAPSTQHTVKTIIGTGFYSGCCRFWGSAHCTMDAITGRGFERAGRESRARSMWLGLREGKRRRCILKLSGNYTLYHECRNILSFFDRGTCRIALDSSNTIQRVLRWRDQPLHRPQTRCSLRGARRTSVFIAKSRAAAASQSRA